MYHPIPYQTKPYLTIPNHIKPNLTKPNQTIPNHIKPNQTTLHNSASSKHHTTAQFKHKRSSPYTLTLTSALYGSGWWRPRSGCFYPRERAGNNCTRAQVGSSADMERYRKPRLRKGSHPEPSTPQQVATPVHTYVYNRIRTEIYTIQRFGSYLTGYARVPGNP
jgi:hypothetical protein